MTREEFTDLTKVEVSNRYYEEAIEPLYLEKNIYKQEFCAGWLKSNRLQICKAIFEDFYKMNVDVCVAEGNKSRLEEARADISKLEVEIKRLSGEIQRTTWRAENAERDAGYQREQASKYAESDKDRVATETALEAARQEIIALKAKLYDFIAAGAA